MRRLLVGLLVIAGCHKGSQSGSSPKEADALWALAPEGTLVGVVATPRALAMVEHAWQDVHAFMAKAPELAPYARMLDEQLEHLTGAPDFKLADFGLTSDKGGAMFVMGEDQVVLVLPVVDRDKFLAKAHGTKGADGDTLEHLTCKTIQSVYACASTEDLFAKLGKAKLRDKLDVRGDIEVVAEGIPGMPMKSAAGVVQLDRGAVTVRGTLDGLPAASLAKLGSPIKPVLDRARSSGLGVINLGAAMADAPDVPIVAGVSGRQLARSLVGPTTISVPAGQMSFDTRVALSDPAPAQALLEHCTDIVPLIGVTFKDGTCHVPVPQLNIGIDGWLDGKTLHIGVKNAPAGKAVPLTRFGAELAEGSWNFAIWGRGSVLAAPPIPMLPTTDASQLAFIGRALMMIEELGAGVRVDGDKLHFVAMVRTAWSNPDDVVAKLATANPSDVLAGKGSAIAAGLPSSAPLARDVEAGYAGLMIPVSFVGVLAAIAIPAYVDYMHKSTKTEASLELNKLAKNLRAYYATTAAFPVGDAPLTPAAPCCHGPHAKCAVDASQWAAGPWKELDFSLDEPHLYQYSYHSDGKTVEADAVGDLDCDGTAITYRLKVDAASGMPQARIEEPPPNTD